MRWAVERVEVRGPGWDARRRAHGPGVWTAGPLEVDLGVLDEVGIAWTVANRGDDAVAVDAVSVVARLVECREPLRALRHGYQSWSPTGVATFGVDADPSRTDGAHWLTIGMHHADPAPAWPGELRSELVTALRDANGDVLVAGFLGGHDHDGTFRLRPAADGSGAIELWVEAFLGGAVLLAGEARSLHAVWFGAGAGDASELLERWAAAAGAASGARTTAPYQVGWCSWYHYFSAVTEADIEANVARADEWPFEIVQVDDGYQRAIGDWLATNEAFPSPLDELAAHIAGAGVTPGIWLAPFLAAPTSTIAAAHPDWVVQHPSGRPLIGMVNDAWGGPAHVLDTTNPAVLEHLESVAADLLAAGFPYLKLDFTYAPSFSGAYLDPSLTPAQRVRRGFDAVRRGAGEDAFLLGCGAPLGAAIGAVDGMRIGPDVAPWWEVGPGQWRPPGYEGGEPATLNAWRATLARSFLHRRLWLNDPDCLMLRSSVTRLTPSAARAWALAVGVSGGMALVSDDLALLDADARSLLHEVLALGRDADDAARAHGGFPPRCPDLLEHATPTRLEAAGVELVGDPGAATALVQPRIPPP